MCRVGVPQLQGLEPLFYTETDFSFSLYHILILEQAFQQVVTYQLHIQPQM